MQTVPNHPPCIHHWVFRSSRRAAWGECRTCGGKRHCPSLDWKCSIGRERTPDNDITHVVSANPGHLYLCPQHLQQFMEGGHEPTTR